MSIVDEVQSLREMKRKGVARAGEEMQIGLPL